MRMLKSFVAALALVVVSTAVADAGRQLSAEDIKRVVRAHAHEVRDCYARHAAKQEGATGHVTLSMIVNEDGRVRRDSVEVEAPGVEGARFSRCVTSNVKSWQFPKSSSSTEVQYPFYFQITHAPGAGPTS